MYVISGRARIRVGVVGSLQLLHAHMTAAASSGRHEAGASARREDLGRVQVSSCWGLPSKALGVAWKLESVLLWHLLMASRTTWDSGFERSVRFWGPNLGHQTYQQMPLPEESAQFNFKQFKLNMVTHSHNPRARKAEAGELGAQGLSWLYSNFEASLAY